MQTAMFMKRRHNIQTRGIHPEAFPNNGVDNSLDIIIDNRFIASYISEWLFQLEPIDLLFFFLIFTWRLTEIDQTHVFFLYFLF